MSENLAVIRATFHDWRTVKGRKMLQLILEVPLEQQGDVLSRLGAPDPSNPQWCAIALLDMAKAQEPQSNAKSEAAKERYRKLPEWSKAAQRAAILCGDARFQDWIIDARFASRFVGSDGRDDATAEMMRHTLGIRSRSEIATNERAYNAFVALEQEFRMATGQSAELRG